MKLRDAVEEYVDTLHDQLQGRAYNIHDAVSRRQFIDELTRRVSAITTIKEKHECDESSDASSTGGDERKSSGGTESVGDTTPVRRHHGRCPCGEPLTKWYQLYHCDECAEQDDEEDWEAEAGSPYEW